MAKSSCKWHGDNGEWTSTQISGIVELGQSERTLPKQSIGNWLYRSTSASNLYLTWFGTLAWTPSPEKHVNQLTFGCMFESNFDLCSISKMKAPVDPNPLANIQPMHKQYDLWIIYVYTKGSSAIVFAEARMGFGPRGIVSCTWQRASAPAGLPELECCGAKFHP